MPDLVLLAVDGDGFLVRRQLTRQGGDAVGCHRSGRPGFIDRLQRVALQPSLPHRFFRVAFRHLGAVPAVLTATKNVPGNNDFSGDVVALADERVGVVAMRRAPFK